MPNSELKKNVQVSIRKPILGNLVQALSASGYICLGPKIEDQALAYTEVSDLSDFPKGITSEQSGGHYRLLEGRAKRFFDITPGSRSWKQFLFPPQTPLFILERVNGHWEEIVATSEVPRQAFISVRACEIAAIEIQDNVFLRDEFQDPYYKSARENAFILAVDCSKPGDTCFCTSMGTGPEVDHGFDLKLSELNEHFVVTIGSKRGGAIMAKLDWEPLAPDMLDKVEKQMEKARRSMGRELPEAGLIPEFLASNLEHPQWDLIAERCLSCSSCTMVCPTCFCWEVEDTTAVTGQKTNRSRVWDSCFSPSYSQQAHGNTRPNTRSRYRQWLSHKLSSWQEQFGSSGCVGCGRCITWCPVGIDLTEEIQSMRAKELA